MPVTEYGGWPNCVRLANDEIELIATSDVGPRIIRLGFVGGENLMKEFPDHMGKTGGDEWRIYGGHRFWHAPEKMPRSYAPDNFPVDVEESPGRVILTQAVEETTGMEKELEIALNPDANHITVIHRLTNRTLWRVEAAPWALTVMARGGTAIFPQEPFRPHPEYMLPARPLVLWHYTDMSDPRFTFGEKYIQLRQDPNATKKNKIGMLNAQEWAAYCVRGVVFVKRFLCVPDARYPDFGCNCESYTDDDMIEIESLGPLSEIEPGESVEHMEDWYLFAAKVGDTEDEIDEQLMPLVAQVVA